MAATGPKEPSSQRFSCEPIQQPLQTLGVGRLDYMIVEPRVRRSAPALGLSPSGQCHDSRARHLRVTTEFLRNLEAAHVGYADVQKHDVRLVLERRGSPRVRPGSYCPALLQPRRRAEQALLTAVQKPVCTASRPGIDDLVKRLGLDGMSQSKVSRFCGEFDPIVEAFGTRPLTTALTDAW